MFYSYLSKRHNRFFVNMNQKHYLSAKSGDMKSTWKVKNEKVLTETIHNNEQEITRINKYMNDFFTTDDEIRKFQSNIASLEAQNKKLEKIEASDLSPDEIKGLTAANLPPAEGYYKKNKKSTIKIPFMDKPVKGQSILKHAIWKLTLNEWQYVGYE